MVHPALAAISTGGGELVRLALVDELELEVARAQGDGGGLALGDDADAQAAQAGKGDAEAVVRGEAFELEAVLACRRAGLREGRRVGRR